MSISYAKLLAICKERGINSTTVRNEKLVGQATWKKIQTGGDIDTRTINKLCKYLNCQPGDILEWVDDGKHNDSK